MWTPRSDAPCVEVQSSRDRAGVRPVPPLGRRPGSGPRRGLAATGRRRGEALALRWRDVDLDAGRRVVRRSAGVVKAKGAGERLVEGPTKTGRSRVVDLDAGTVAAPRAYRTARGLLALDLVRNAALVLSRLSAGTGGAASDARSRIASRSRRSACARVRPVRVTSRRPSRARNQARAPTRCSFSRRK